jgi:signal transduction histidine kinase
VVIEVADTGIGIPLEDQDKIFDRFFRSSSIADLAVPGTGLGLWITKTIIEEHGGEITVSSVRGEGTQFTVTLPCAGARPGRAAARGDAGEEGERIGVLRGTAVLARRPFSH